MTRYDDFQTIELDLTPNKLHLMQRRLTLSLDSGTFYSNCTQRFLHLNHENEAAEHVKLLVQCSDHLAYYFIYGHDLVVSFTFFQSTFFVAFVVWRESQKDHFTFFQKSIEIARPISLDGITFTNYTYQLFRNLGLMDRRSRSFPINNHRKFVFGIKWILTEDYRQKWKLSHHWIRTCTLFS